MTNESQDRVTTVVRDFMERIRDGIVANEVTYDEYAAVKQYFVDVGTAGEWPLFGDVFFESTVERVDSEGREGTDSAIEGPYYIPGAPVLEAPAIMPMRDNEPGDALVLSGSVKAADGTPLPGAVLDMWHSDSDGIYSGIPYPDSRELPPPGNLRGKITADENGRFEVRTIVPVPYEIPKSGPTGALLRAAGWHAFRPAHLHVFATADGHRKQTVQLYFESDPYIDSDIADAVKPSLILKLEKAASGAADPKWKLDGPYYTTSYEFRLAPA